MSSNQDIDELFDQIDKERFNKTTILCKYCGVTIPLSNNSGHKKYFMNRFSAQTDFDRFKQLIIHNQNSLYPYIEIHFVKCATCFNTTIFSYLVSSETDSKKFSMQPISEAKGYPDYVPAEQVQDYSESVAIAELSPRASLTLSRRCAQGLIRHKFPDVKQGNLFSEIKQLKTRVSQSEYRALNSLRHLGNTGAHPEKENSEFEINKIEVSSEEAQHAITIIEFLIKKWFVEPHDDEMAIKTIMEDAHKLKPDVNLDE
ncbi:hypothetical protein R82265_HNDDMDAM_00117 [Fructobacillus cardui]|uniref:DUF4145 domain-containing protein n=1 Tax=Fructobacillus cardui TaxID=2893170 RepID=UPI002DB0C696|nr:hypothetical protein R82265_HNDDMDAM_00117 [Fructobacillus cardui]